MHSSATYDLQDGSQRGMQGERKGRERKRTREGEREGEGGRKGESIREGGRGEDRDEGLRRAGKACECSVSCQTGTSKSEKETLPCEPSLFRAPAAVSSMSSSSSESHSIVPFGRLYGMAAPVWLGKFFGDGTGIAPELGDLVGRLSPLPPTASRAKSIGCDVLSPATGGDPVRPNRPFLCFVGMPPASLPGAAASPSSPPPFCRPAWFPMAAVRPLLAPGREAPQRPRTGSREAGAQRERCLLPPTRSGHPVVATVPVQNRDPISGGSRSIAAEGPRVCCTSTERRPPKLRPSAPRVGAMRCETSRDARPRAPRSTSRCAMLLHHARGFVDRGRDQRWCTPRTRCTRSTNLPNWNFGTLCFKDTKVVPPHEPSRLFAVPGKACPRSNGALALRQT